MEAFFSKFGILNHYCYLFQTDLFTFNLIL